MIEQPAGFLTKLFAPQEDSGLLTQLLAYLTTENKTKEAILLINPYKNTNAITKKLALEIISKDHFYRELRSSDSKVLGSRLSPMPESSTRLEHIPLSIHR